MSAAKVRGFVKLEVCDGASLNLGKAIKVKCKCYQCHLLAGKVSESRVKVLALILVSLPPPLFGGYIALCESCNGEVPMINFQFLHKNLTFTF